MTNIENLVPIEHNDQRILLTSQLAEMYETTPQVLTNNFNRNKGRYRQELDFIALEGEAKTRFLNQTQIDLGSAKNAKTLYLWTEHGALLHAKSLGTDQAWKVYGQLVDCYFMAKAGALPAAEKPAHIDRDARAEAMRLNAKRRIAKDCEKLYAAVGIKPEYQLLAMQSYYGKDGPILPAAALGGAVAITYDKGAIAEKVGVYSKSGKPHAQAVGAVIRQLQLTDDEAVQVPYMNNGHDGFDIQYTESVIGKVKYWIDLHGHPSSISKDGKNYQIVYRTVDCAGKAC